MRKESTLRRDMADDFFQVRWTDQDKRNDIPARLRKALEKHERNRQRSGVARLLLIRWLELAEQADDPLTRTAAALVIAERPAREYGAAKKQSSGKKKKS